MAKITNLLNKLNPSTGEFLAPRTVEKWRDGITDMSDALCGGLYSKDIEIDSPTFGSYFKWNAAGPWPVSRLKVVNQANFQKLIDDFGDEQATLLLDKKIIIEEDIIIPENIKISFSQGSDIEIASGVVMTINSEILEPRLTLFTGQGNVSLATRTIFPEWWGAKSDGFTPSGIALQRMLDAVGLFGADVDFGVGSYLVDTTLVPKKITPSPTLNYKLTLRGKGQGKTVIKGSGFSGDMIFIDNGLGVGGSSADNSILIEGIRFIANGAARILYASYLVNAKINNNDWIGGENHCIEIGTVAGTENYSVYMDGNYFNGGTINTGQNNGLLKITNARFFEIYRMETDGGRYAIEIQGNSDKNKIIGGKLEGAKRAAILIEGTGGGENEISQVYINPYGLYDRNGQYDGTISGIEIKSTGFSNASNKISLNTIFLGNPSEITGTISADSGSPIISTDSYLLTGQTSGATGRLYAYSTITGRFVIRPVTGSFSLSETILQDITGASFTITQSTKIAYGIRSYGDRGLNRIVNNDIRGGATYGIFSQVDGNTISGNYIEAATGIETGKNGLIADNYVYASLNSYNRTDGNQKFAGNVSANGLSNIPESYITPDGDRTLTGKITLNGTENTVSNLRVPNRMLPVTPSNVDVGAVALPFKDFWGVSYHGESIQSISISGVNLLTQDGTTVARASNEGNFLINTVADDEENELQVNGTIKAVDLILSNLPIAIDNADAISYGVSAGVVYRTPTGDIRVVYNP